MTKTAPGRRSKNPPLFPLGQIVATPGALESCSPDYLYHCLFRHSRGDWGTVCKEDAASNREAVRVGSRRILSSSGDFYYLEDHTPLNAYMANLEAEAGKLTDQPVRVTPRFDGLNGYPMWSPDGTKLAWFGLKHFETLNDARLVLRDLATGNETDVEMRISAGNGPSPAWLSDGRSIVVGVWEKGVHSLYKVNPATGQGTELVRNTGPNQNQLSWSADGSKIYQVENSKSIAMRDTGSSEAKVIFTDSEAGFIRDITPSPDGSRIAYVSNAKDGQIKLLTPATGHVMELVNVWPAWNRRMMTWTPDGHHLIYVTEASQERGQPTALWIVPAGGGAPKQLTQNLEGRVFDVSLSPDGKQIGFSRWAGHNEIWAMENFLPK
jgi:Tol biopolymer transport system component